MATYQFSALADGQTISFNPNTDVLNFDNTGISAAGISAVAEGANLRVSFGSKDVLLTNVSPLQVTTGNITFANGSRLFFGDNTTGTANDNAANSSVGTAGNDLLQGFGGADTLNGGAGDDTYIVGTGDTLIDSGGVDRVYSDVSWTIGTGFELVFLTGTANASVTGNNESNLIEGNAGNNYFNARGGSDTIFGGAGNDTIDMSSGGTGLQGRDSIDGGDGIDTVDYDGYATSGIVAVLTDSFSGFVSGGGTGGEGSTSISNVERLIGGAFNDSIRGNAAANYLDGRAGNDTIEGGVGNDTLIGGTGADTLVFDVAPGASNADLVTGFVSGTDRLALDAPAFSGIGEGSFVAGDPRFWASSTGTAHDANDRVIYNTSNGQLWYDADGNGAGAAQLIATLQGAPALVATDISITNGGSHITGTNGDDSLTGTDASDTIEGFGGNDTLEGGDSADLLIGGDGNDRLDAGNFGLGDGFRDSLDGGLGDDEYFVTDDGDVILQDAGGFDVVHVDGGEWTLGAGLENLDFFGIEDGGHGIGNELDNVIDGGGAFSHVEGRGGNDLLKTSGRSFLEGGDGNDTLLGSGELDGGNGNDVLNGLGGDFDHPDTLTGGSGDDTFVFDGTSWDMTRVTDFASGSDILVLDADEFAGIGANGRFGTGDARFWSSSTGTAHDTSDRIIYNTATGELWHDADGNGSGTAVLVAVLDGAPGLNAMDIEVVNGGSSGQTINGTAGNDSLIGTAGNDTINGLAGNDTIDGNGGSDSLVGGDGDDRIENGFDEVPASGGDTLLGGNGNDTLDATSGGNPTFGSRTADTLDGGLGNDLFIIDRDDVVSDAGGIDTIEVKDMDWTLGAEFENLIVNTDLSESGATGIGNGLNNEMWLTFAGGRLEGLGGNDTLHAGSHESDLFGGDGDDLLIDTGSRVSLLDGGAGNDTLFGEGAVLTGGAGADHFAPQGPETESGAPDTITDFASGVDRLRIDGAKFHNSGPSGDFSFTDERFYSAAGATAAHDATDRLIYNTSTGDLYYDEDGTGSANAFLVATLQGAPALNGSDIYVINGSNTGSAINGTAGDDSLVGTAGNDTINGLGGNDTLLGVDGSDTLVGGDGNDYLEGQGHASSQGGNPGADLLIGGAGDDTLDGALSETQFEAFTADVLDGGLGNDVFHIDRADDVIIDAGGIDTIAVHALPGWTLADGYENLQLFDGEGQGSMFGIGNAANNVIDATFVRHAHLEGLGGNDMLVGGGSDNTLLGGDGNDTLVGNGDMFGDAGNDVLNGFADDSLTGGTGADRFVFDNAFPGGTRITDFQSGADKVVLDGDVYTGSGISGLFSAGDARFWASSSGTAHDASDRVVYNTATGQLWYDGDGTGASDPVLIATLEGAPAFSATDVEIVNGSSGSTIDGTAGNDSLTGTAGDDTINGLAGADTLSGLAGNDRLSGQAGIDRLQGGAGNDAFVFDMLGSENRDIVLDFASGVDKLQMEDSVMTAIGPTGNFAAGDARFFAAAGVTSGHDANDRIIYNTTTGDLYYDADGSGAGATRFVGNLSGHPVLAATDIAVI